jgi:integrase/recombinase XerD
LERRELRPSTISGYVCTLNQFINLGLRLEDFNNPYLGSVVARLAPDTVSRNSLNQYINRLAKFGQWLCQNHFTEQPHRTRRHPHRPQERDLPTKEDWRILFDALLARATSGDQMPLFGRLRRQDYLIARTLYETGCRISEVLNLCREDVRTDNQYCWLIITKGKTDSATRAVPITNMLYAALQRHAGKLLRGRLFSSRSGRALRHQHWSSFISNFASKLGLSCHIHPHLFRYAKIVSLILEGKSAIEVMSRIGHRNPQQTVYYFNQVRRLYPFVEIAYDLALLERHAQTSAKIFGRKKGLKPCSTKNPNLDV